MATQARMPAHLWAVGGLSLLWNGFGAFDYIMTQTNNEAYLSQFTAEQLAYFQSFPTWMEAFWALGVWGSVIGSIMLLMRSRHAVHAFGVSLVGMIVGLGYQYLVMDMPDSLKSGMMGIMPWVILIVGIALFLYARKQAANGLLR